MRHSRLLIPALAAALLPLAPATHAAGSVLIGPANGLKFNLTPGTGFDPTTGTGLTAFQDFQTAALRWSSLFSDNITINLTVGLGTFSNGNIIGATSSTQANYAYSGVRSALVTDARSADDLTAVANLPVGPNFSERINYTSNNPNGSGSATPYTFTTSNTASQNFPYGSSTVYMTNANAKALNIYGGSSTANDATITFNSAFAFDYNEADGVDANKIDFLFVATHEIGHSLGFISGVDILDGNAGFLDSQYTFKSTLDLFRYSADSFAAGKGITDFTSGASPKYFSLDGGVTMLSSNAFFSTGSKGDGSQASHWKDNLGAGIMDPTAGFGETGFITQNDIRAFDAMGYNLSTPEPSQMAAFGLGFLGLGALALKARRRSVAA